MEYADIFKYFHNSTRFSEFTFQDNEFLASFIFSLQIQWSMYIRQQ